MDITSKVIIGGLSVVVLATGIWAGSLMGKLSDVRLDNSNYKVQVASLLDNRSLDASTIEDLKAQLVALQAEPNAVYFPNRTAITAWLGNVPKLGVSIDAVEWYQYALYYQQQALEAGYIISVAYIVYEGSIAVWCEVVDANGRLYYFDPDDCILEDSDMHVNIAVIEGYSLKDVGYSY